jgi:hypothetical protein
MTSKNRLQSCRDYGEEQIPEHGALEYITSCIYLLAG